MEKDSFAETFFSFPQIDNKEKSTYYNSFYTKNTLKKPNNLISSKFTENSSKCNKGRNRVISSFGKYASQLTNNMYNKNNKNKLTVLLKNKYSFSSEETDDTFFALSEIRHLDRQISRRVNKGIIWKEQVNNIYDKCTSQNKKDIDNIRKCVRLSLSNDNFDLKAEIEKKKYFPVEKIEVINEAKRIMDEIKKTMISNKKAYKAFGSKNKFELHDYVMKNRAICKNNFVIDVLNSERNKIKIKEKEIKKALKDANYYFLKDKDSFENFRKEQKRHFRETDLRLDENVRRNKMILERLKKHDSDVRATENEIERNIKGIILFSNYADFVHKLLGKEKINLNVNIIKSSFQNRENLSHITNLILKKYDFLLNSGELPIKAEEVNNPDLLSSLLFSLEGTIIQQMEHRDEVIKEKGKLKVGYDSEIFSLRKKLEENQKKLITLSQKLQQEKIRYSTHNYQTTIDEVSVLIYEIHNELKYYNSTGEEIVDQRLNAIIKNTLGMLKKLEDKLYIIFKDLDIMKEDENNPDEIVKKIIEKVKLKNKARKHKEGKEAILKLKQERDLKFLRRMNRYKQRGPIVYPPPQILNKKKGNSTKIKKISENENEMLYYK